MNDSGDFVKFCFENAIQTSHAPQEAIKKVMENEEDFYKLMHPSDLAYAVTGLVNNEDKWRTKFEKDKKKKQTEEAKEAAEAETEVVLGGLTCPVNI